MRNGVKCIFVSLILIISSIIVIPPQKGFKSEKVKENLNNLNSAVPTEYKKLIEYKDISNKPLGVWIYTLYNGIEKYTEIKMSLIEFIYTILHPHHGIPVSVDVNGDGIDDVDCEIRFYLTSLPPLSFGLKSVLGIKVRDRIEGDMFVSLDIHVPIIFSNNYISMKSGFIFSDGQPNEIKVGFSFSPFNTVFGKRTFKMDVIPEYYYKGNLTALYSFSIYSSSGSKYGEREFEILFSPATELHITTVPRELKAHYSFGKNAGERTKVKFRSYENGKPLKSHNFIIDPLPSYMSFDLSILGKGKFTYRSDRPFDVAYYVESEDEENIPIKIEIVNIPTSIDASWGIDLKLVPLSLHAYADLDMSSNVERISLYYNNSKEPVMSIKNFPRKLRIEGYLDRSLHGSISTSKYSGSQTEISTTFRVGKWRVDGSLYIKDGSMSVEWNLPRDKKRFITFDTNNREMLGIGISLIDTENNTKFLVLSIEGISTDDFGISWNPESNGVISKFKWTGRINRLRNFRISVYHEGGYFNISGDWIVGKEGNFFVELNRDVDVTFANISSDNFKLYSHISLYANRKIKFDWEWGDTGHFTIYTFNKAIGKSLYVEFGYGEKQNDTYRYGFKLTATNFLNVTRTVMWDTVNGILPRIWILGDEPLPGDWSAWLLWNYKWYEVV